MATGTVILDCARIKHPTVAAIDYLARLKLGLRRGDCKMRLANCSDELKHLIELAGLAETLGVRPKILGERFGDPGGSDSGEAPSSGASASVDA
jgi:anti-anti-sigma regulatory factor